MSFPEQIKVEDAELMVRSSEALREIQDNNLRRQVALCAQYSDYYRRLFAREKIDPASIRTLEDLRLLPLTFREDFLREPESFRMSLEKGNIYERIIWNVCYTTSFVAGKPSPFYNTSHDYLSMIHQGRRLASFLDLFSDDVIINLFPLSPMPNVGYLLVPAKGSGLSLPVVDAIPGSPYRPYPVTRNADHCAAIIQRQGGTIIWGVSGFVRKVIMRARENHMNLSRLRIVILSGEPTPIDMVADIRARLSEVGAPHARVLRSYGFTELQGGLLECTPQSGFHCLNPEEIYLEVVDPITRKPLREGEEGLVVMTHLDRRGTVLLRYATGDRSSMSNEPCPHCGSSVQRILKEPYYTGDLADISGHMINPTLILSELSSIKEVEQWQLVFEKEDPQDPFSLDALEVRGALSYPHKVDLEILRTAIVERVRLAAEITPRVRFVPPEEIFDPSSQMKMSRILDRRPRRAPY